MCNACLPIPAANAATGHYHLPDHRAAVLTRPSDPDNIAVVAQYIGMLGAVEDRVVDCFRDGGGVAYTHSPRFHEVMAEDSGQTMIAALDRDIGLVERLEHGMRVLDIGCGRGRALLNMAARFPQSRFVGYDLSGGALSVARAEARRREITNVVVEQRDLSDFDRAHDDDRTALTTPFDAIHDQADPQGVLNGIRRALSDNGTFLMQDIRASSQLENKLEHPIGPLLYTLSTMHCMTLSLAQNGAGLGTMWGERKWPSIYCVAQAL